MSADGATTNSKKDVDADADDDEEEEEEDLAKLQAEIARMEEEAARITQETEELEKIKNAKAAAAAASADGNSNTAGTASADDGGKAQAARDAKSVYVGQVDYSATPVELLSHFEACGTVERVTIVCDKYTGRPKGFAYLEFQTEQAVENALKLDGSEFKGRQLKITHKRVNQPAFLLYQQQQAATAASAAGTAGAALTAAPGADGTVVAGGRGRGGPPFLRGGRGAAPFRGGGFRGGRGAGGGFRGGYRGGYRGGGGGGGRGYHPYY